MPELPEVEALAAFVASRAAGKTISRVEVVSFAAVKTALPPPSALVGRTVLGATRRGKYLVIETGPGGQPGDAPPLFLAVHFSRAGWLVWHDAPAAVRPTIEPALRAVPPRSLRRGPRAFAVTFADGSAFDLTEVGTQKRLAISVVGDPGEVPGIARLGIEPLDPAFDAATLGRLLKGRTGQLKHLLSDQGLIAGVGNAYSDEALHAARLSPFRPAGNLSDEELGRLHDALVGQLRKAVDRSRGLAASELKDDKRAAMRVHGRTGLPCPVCGDTIREVAYSQRSLQYCPTCQTAGKVLADRRLSRLLK